MDLSGPDACCEMNLSKISRQISAKLLEHEFRRRASWKMLSVEVGQTFAKPNKGQGMLLNS